MSNFKLDIDYPTEPLMAEKFTSAPSKVPYTAGHIRYRHYGKDIELMINRAVSMEEGPERDEFVMLIANHMKNCCSASPLMALTTARFSRIWQTIHTGYCASTHRPSDCMNSKL